MKVEVVEQDKLNTVNWSIPIPNIKIHMSELKSLITKNLRMYCISINPLHLDMIKKLDYIPVGKCLAR